MKMSVQERFVDWPNLVDNSFKKTSECEPAYNCVAWAINKTNRWIDAYSRNEWPNDLVRTHTAENYADFFKRHGFVICKNKNLEEGIEKLAIFVDSFGYFTHVAVQLIDGKWSSKLGKIEDIKHETLDVLTGGLYGIVKIFMQRPRKDVKKIE